MNKKKPAKISRGKIKVIVETELFSNELLGVVDKVISVLVPDNFRL